MSWKPNKVSLLNLHEDRNLVDEKTVKHRQDLTITTVPSSKSQGPVQPLFLPTQPIKLEPSTIIIATTTNNPCPTPSTSLSDETLAMPPPPPPPQPRTPISPPTGVSSTSSEEIGASFNSTNDRSDIEFDGNDQVLCRVCGDKASGFHYGVHSCEGCKGFFRRSIQQKIQYRPCTKNQQCNILRINRNRCQYCRLKKCIAAGMSRDAVRFGRVPKREKAKIMAAMQNSRMKTQESRVQTEMSDEGKIIETIVKAHYESCDYTRSKMESFLSNARNKASYAIFTGTTCPMKGRPEESFLEQFSEKFMDHVRQVCTFAKQVPGFKCLHHDDQVTLLKSCVFEVLLVRLTGLFENQGLVCLNGDIIRKETISQMPPGNAKFLMDSVFELAQRLNQFRLSDAEIGVFCAVVIITPDRPGLRNPELVQKMQNKLKVVLNRILLPHHSEHSSMFSELMTMIHDLKTLNTLHTEKFLQQCKVTATPPTSIQNHIFYNASSMPWRSHQQQQQHRAHLDREGSTGNLSPHSSDTSNEDHSSRRSPIGSVSSSESIQSSEVSKLTGHDLRVNGSVLMNALTTSAPSGCPFVNTATAAAATVTITRKRSIAEEQHVNHALSVENSAATISTVTKYKVRKVDSPIDSGIDSPKAGQGSSHSTNTSVCSSPRSSMEEESQKKEPELADPQQQQQQQPQQQSGPRSHQQPEMKPDEQHPLLKRALQQPPQPYNNMGVMTFQDEVYKPHKKFRRMALSSGDDCPSSSTGYTSSSSPPTPPIAHTSSPVSNSTSASQNSLLVTQLSQPIQHQTMNVGGGNSQQPSLLASTLSKAAPMAQEQSKRNEILANLILNNPSTSSSNSSYPRASQSPSAGLLMCARSSSAAALAPTSTISATTTSSACAATTSASLMRHIPVQAAPTKPSKTTNPAAKESKMSQLAAAAAATLAAETPQPLNLSTRTPPPASQHDIPTEA